MTGNPNIVTSISIFPDIPRPLWRVEGCSKLVFLCSAEEKAAFHHLSVAAATLSIQGMDIISPSMVMPCLETWNCLGSVIP